MRQLDQDVRKFWQFVYEQAGGNPAEARKLARDMVGRNADGRSLGADPESEQFPDSTEATRFEQNQFTFEIDPAGARCPFGAHVRRANPRNADFPERPANLSRSSSSMLGFGPNRFRRRPNVIRPLSSHSATWS